MLRRVLAVLSLSLVVMSGLEAQRPQTRSGFWFQGGLGGGSAGCEDCGDRTSGGTAVIALGGTLSRHVLLGASIHGWARSEDNATLSVSARTAAAHIYPWSRAGFFFNVGVGAGSTQLEFGPFTVEEDGPAFVAGIGYDIRIGRNVSLTPFTNGYGINYDEGTINAAQLGLSITVH